MECENLKKTLKKIEMPDSMKTRIIEKCISENICKTEDNRMNKNIKRRIKKSAVLVAAVVLCVCIALVAGAAGGGGFFKDIHGYDGAVIGTVYKNAGDEITVSAVSDGEMLIVRAAMVYPDAVPYIEQEHLGMSKYQIIDAEGKIIEEGEQTESFGIIDGVAEIKLVLNHDVSEGCRVVIDGFIGSKKADQDLLMEGIWDCLITGA